MFRIVGVHRLSHSSFIVSDTDAPFNLKRIEGFRKRRRNGPESPLILWRFLEKAGKSA